MEVQLRRLRRVKRRAPLSLEAVLIGEALTSGFYVAVTRGLSPILLTVAGLSIRRILLLSLVAYTTALVAIEVVKRFRARVLRSLKEFLVPMHGAERILWSSLPFVLPLGMYVMAPVYSLAIALGTVNGMLINTIVYGAFEEKGAQRLITRRTASSATSNVIGQLVSVLSLAVLTGISKYATVFVMAGSIGVIATIFLAFAKVPSIAVEPKARSRSEAEEFEARALGIYLTALMASMSILAVSWAPYLIKVKGSSEYVAASLGLMQMISSIFSSIFWSRMSFSKFKLALAPLIAIPVLIPLTPSPLLDPGVAFLYAFLATGASLLASYILARLSSSLTPLRASARLAESASLAQVIGLGTALLSSLAGYWAIFVTSALYLVIALVVAFTSIPEVSLIPREQAIVHARRLYITTSATLGFIVVMTRRAALLTLRITALTLALLLVALVYKVLQYLIVLP